MNPVKQRIYRLTAARSYLESSGPLDAAKASAAIAGAAVHRVSTYPMPGYSEVKMFYRYGGFLPRHHDRHQPLGADVPEPQAGVRGQPGLLVVHRDPAGRYHLAGLHQLRAQRHRRMGKLRRLLAARLRQLQPPRDRLPAEMHRAAGRIQDRTTGSSAGSPRGWACTRNIPKATRRRTGSRRCSTVGPAQSTFVRGVQEEGLLRRAADPETTSPPGAALVLRRPGLRHPGLQQPQARHRKGPGAGTYSGKIEFVSESLKANTPDDEERPPMPRYIPSWEGHESRAVQEVSRSQLISPHPRFSFHTHHDHHVPWLSEIPGHRLLTTATYWVARMHPRTPRPGASSTATSSSCTTTGRRCCASRRSPRGSRPGVVHSYEGSASYDPIEPGKAGTTDRGGCVNMLTPGRMLSQNVAGHGAQLLPHRDP